MKIYKVFPFVTILFFFNTSSALACMCEPPPPPCYAYSESQAVFVGTIKNVIQDLETFSDKVEVDVEQSFSGMQSKNAFTYNYNHSCAWTFKKGEKFLFYANLSEKDKSNFGTGLCTRTSVYSENLIDFEFLNLVKNPAPTFWIWGTLSKVAEKSYLGHQPIEGISAQVFDNKKKLVGISDAMGNLKISVSKEGIYKVRVFPPKGTMLDQSKLYNSFFKDKISSLVDYNFQKTKPFVEYKVEVKANKCGWFYLPLEKFRKE